jgi:hypothetical protein
VWHPENQIGNQTSKLKPVLGFLGRYLNKTCNKTKLIQVWVQQRLVLRVLHFFVGDKACEICSNTHTEHGTCSLDTSAMQQQKFLWTAPPKLPAAKWCCF